jgi:NAD(P)-dependent dehydrogenase (short-subunit alcohol dehydrogenase family)
MSRLEGKIALVTGAGGGIGRAIVSCFAQAGAEIVASDRDNASLAKLTKEQPDIITHEADVTRLEDVQAMVANMAERFGRLDVLVNNAGVPSRSDFRHLSDEDWSSVIDVNLQGTARCMRESFELLKISGDAAIVNMGSIMETRHIRQLSAYAASKAAVGALTRSVAVEYAPFGIRVNAVTPGYVETAMTKSVLRNEAMREALLLRTPLKRFAEPSDIAQATLFLASVEAKSITGQCLIVDAGASVAF